MGMQALTTTSDTGTWLDNVLKQIPGPNAALPPVPDADAIARHAADTLRALVDAGTNPSTKRALAGSLRYWSAWHWAVWGTDLPLLANPAVAVPPDTVGVFIAHHWPRRRGDRVTIAMPESVKARMQGLSEAAGSPIVGKRRVAKRDRSGAIDDDVPSLATLRHRIHMLNALHQRLGVGPLPTDHAQVRMVLKDLRRAVAKDAPRALTLKASPLKFDDLVRLLDALPSSEEGVRDRALLLVQFFGGGRRRAEVMRCRIEDFRRDARGATTWFLKNAKGRVADDADAVIAKIALPRAVGDALAEWFEVLARYDVRSGDVWRAYAKPRGRPRKTVTPEAQLRTASLGGRLRDDYVNELVRRLAIDAGVCLTNLTSHSIRHGYVETMLDAGVTAQDVMGMTLHKSIQSFVGYGGGAPREAAKVGEALASTLEA